MFGILSRGMQVAKNGKCNNLQQNESIWEERIELITHIDLSSQVNLAWTRIKNTTINWGIWHRINSNKFIEITILNNNFDCHWPFFNLKLQNNVQPVFHNILDIASPLSLGHLIVKTTTTWFRGKLWTNSPWWREFYWHDNFLIKVFDSSTCFGCCSEQN